jgi:hypothetical protein
MIYFNGFYFLDYPGEFDYLKTHLKEATLEDFNRRNHKALLMATYSGKEDSANFYKETYTDEDLTYLRSEIGILGKQQGLIDVFGRKWPRGISAGFTSDGGDWKREKIKQLSDYRFSIAFENTNLKYYVTEKIWDAIYAGALPVYYGNAWVYEIFEKGSFIDYGDFSSPSELLEYLKNMQSDEWLKRMKKCVDTYNRSVDYVTQVDILEATRERIRQLFL